MQPILILQFMRDDGPGYLGTWARQEGIACTVLNAAAGDTFPASTQGYRALALLGGAMSANDDLPYLRDAERLIQRCVAEGLPVIGHCLGGQLMARALGAQVAASPAPEVGWHRMQVADNAHARDWFGDATLQHVFHWHYDAFELPAHAVALGSSPACPVQAFVMGPHVGLQFHVEIDDDKIESWLSTPDPLYAAAQLKHPSVQSPSSIRQRTRDHLTAQQSLAGRIYSRWLLG